MPRVGTSMPANDASYWNKMGYGGKARESFAGGHGGNVVAWQQVPLGDVAQTPHVEIAARLSDCGLDLSGESCGTVPRQQEVRGEHMGSRFRLRATAGVMVAVAFGLAGTIQAEDPRPTSAARGRSRTAPMAHRPQEAPKRLRQGTVLRKVKGEFRLTGERVAFYPQDLEVKEMTVLENLALERLTELVAENRRRLWLVDGVVTEFRGRNYLLVSRAVLTAEPVSRRSEP